MSKYSWLFTIVFISVIITLVAQQIELVTVQGIIDNTLPDAPDLTIGTVSSFMDTYWNLLTFNVIGVPALVSVLFLPFNLVAGVIVVELVIKAISALPFT